MSERRQTLLEQCRDIAMITALKELNILKFMDVRKPQNGDLF